MADNFRTAWVKRNPGGLIRVGSCMWCRTSLYEPGTEYVEAVLAIPEGIGPTATTSIPVCLRCAAFSDSPTLRRVARGHLAKEGGE